MFKGSDAKCLVDSTVRVVHVDTVETFPRDSDVKKHRIEVSKSAKSIQTWKTRPITTRNVVLAREPETVLDAMARVNGRLLGSRLPVERVMDIASVRLVRDPEKSLELFGEKDV